MKVVSWNPKYKKDFIDMNRRRMAEILEIEEEDFWEREHIEASLSAGGKIFIAADDDEKALACCMAVPRRDDEWEITHFTAEDKSVATACFKAAFYYIRRQNASRIVIFSNQKFSGANRIYKACGFVEISADREKLPDPWVNIVYERTFDYPELYSRIAESFDKQTFLVSLGAELEDVSPGRVVISCRKNENLLQQQGFIHGGVTMSLADSAAGYSALTTMPENREVLTVELKINMMRPAAGEVVRAEGRVIKSGRTLVVVESRAFSEDDVEIARLQGTMISVDKS